MGIRSIGLFGLFLFLLHFKVETIRLRYLKQFSIPNKQAAKKEPALIR